MQQKGRRAPRDDAKPLHRGSVLLLPAEGSNRVRQQRLMVGGVSSKGATVRALREGNDAAASRSSR